MKITVLLKNTACGVSKKFMGKEFMGVIRSTFVVNKEGRIAFLMPKVNTKTHHKDVFKCIEIARLEYEASFLKTILPAVSRCLFCTDCLEASQTGIGIANNFQSNFLFTGWIFVTMENHLMTIL